MTRRMRDWVAGDPVGEIPLWNEGYPKETRDDYPHLALQATRLVGADAWVSAFDYYTWQRCNAENDRNGTWSPGEVYEGDGALIHWIEGTRFVHVVAGVVDGVALYKIANHEAEWGLFQESRLTADGDVVGGRPIDTREAV